MKNKYGATFSDGIALSKEDATLSWEELKLEENGAQYEYIASAISAEHMDDYAFMYCNYLTSIAISEGVTSIGCEVFASCPYLTNITIPNSVTTIGKYAFFGCTNLTSIDIPVGITNICGGAFSYCTNLTTINYAGTVEQWNAIGLGYNWNMNVPATKVICSDGTVALS